jgi:hypothetical protein
LLEDIRKLYEVITSNSEKLFSKQILTIDFKISKLILLTDTFGSLIGLDVTKNAIKRGIRAPDELVLISPLIELKEKDDLEDYFINDATVDEDQITYDTIVDNFDHFGETYNFFQTSKEELCGFPSTVIISPSNSPYKENSAKLYSFLLNNNVPVNFEQITGYNKFCLQYPSLYSTSNESSINLAFSYINKSINDKNYYRMASDETACSELTI